MINRPQLQNEIDQQFFSVLKFTNLEFGASRKHFPDEALAELHGVDEGVEGHGKVLSVFMHVYHSCQYT